jgi:hypothetical protein
MNKEQINEIKQFMAEYWPEYLPKQNDLDNVLTYVYDDPGEQPSCLVAIILFCIGIIPGIIYLVLGGRKPQKHVVNIRILKDNNLFNFTGKTSSKIAKSYQAYQEKGDSININRYKNNRTPIFIAIAIWIIIGLIILF